MITYAKIAQYVKNGGGDPAAAYNEVFLVYQDGETHIEHWNVPGIPRPPDETWEDYPEYDPVPQKVTKRQLRLALADDEHYPEQVEGLIGAAYAEAPAKDKEKALIEWHDALSYERTHPLVLSLAPLLDYDTDEKIDDVFRRAGTYV